MLIVRCDNHGSVGRNGLKQVQYACTSCRIKFTSGLIGNQYIRIRNECASDGNALPFPPTEGRRPVVQSISQSDFLK
jgi:hypothetical protein